MSGTPIVVGYDGSNSAQAALDWAMTEAARLVAPVRVVHVLQWPTQIAAVTPGPPLYPDESSHRAAEELVRTAVRSAVRERPAVAVTGHVRIGAAVPELVGESGAASMLVLGHRGHHGFPSLLLGSVGVAVSAQAHCPVVIIRGPHDERDAARGERRWPRNQRHGVPAQRDRAPYGPAAGRGKAADGPAAGRGKAPDGPAAGCGPTADEAYMGRDRTPDGPYRTPDGPCTGRARMDLPGELDWATGGGPAGPGAAGLGAAGAGGTGRVAPTPEERAHGWGLPAADQVLVGFDGSACACRAIGVAFRAAATHGTGVHVLHAWAPPAVRWRSPDAASRNGDADREQVERAALADHLAVVDAIQPWRRRYPRVPVTVDLVADGAGRALIAASTGARLVVVGSCGHGSLRGLLFGSVSQQLVHHSGAPVVIVHETPRNEVHPTAV